MPPADRGGRYAKKKPVAASGGPRTISSAEQRPTLFSTARSEWMAWIHIQDLATGLQDGVFKLADPLRIWINTSDRIAGLNNRTILEDIDCHAEKHLTDVVGVQLAKVTLQVMQSNVVKASCIHDQIAVRVGYFEEPHIERPRAIDWIFVRLRQISGGIDDLLAVLEDQGNGIRLLDHRLQNAVKKPDPIGRFEHSSEHLRDEQRVLGTLQ